MRKYILSLTIVICTVFVAYGQRDSIIVTSSTKFGKPVEVIIYTELTSSERAALNNWVENNYPNVEILEYATNEYNCHGYAWLMQDGFAPGWIYQYTSTGKNNLSLYWTNDYYTETTENDAVKIFYYNGDHSAVPSPTVAGKYISKWGAGPLVLHSPDDCPYVLNRRYYKKNKYIGTNLGCSIANRAVHVNELANYYIRYNAGVSVPNGNTLKYNWTVVDNKNEENVIGDLATVTSNGNNANIAISKAGLYMITCNVTTETGEHIVSYNLQAVIEN